MLRAGATAGVLGHRVMAPSTIGTFLRSFTFGHSRQIEAVNGHAFERAWAVGVGPGAEPLVIDIDSTICEVDGKAKQGAGYGYTHKLGYRPLLATRADTGEVLHARMRKGSANTQRGTVRFLDEVVARVRRAVATGELTVRVDSGFWSNDTIVALNRLDVRSTTGVRCGTKALTAAIAGIPETAWADIDYTPDWRHHALLADLTGPAVEVDTFHRHHAVVELAIRDLKHGARLEHVPSGNFHANSVWLQCAVLAHNLIRWTTICGGVRTGDQLIVARTVRTQLLTTPGRFINRAGRQTLRLPTGYS